MSRYKAYPEYKDSGVEWLGEIPPHWHSRQLKYLCSYNDEVLSEATSDDYEIEYVDISSVSAIDGISNTEAMLFGDAPSRARRIVRDGDILISTVRTYLEAIASVQVPPNNLIASTGFAVIRPNAFLNKGYAAYCLRASGFIKEVVAKSVGVSYPAINASDLVNIKNPEPSIAEQEKIAAFLDHETAKIDALIEKQQRLIELLKEKRQAVISHAVTKGLNPNAPMKDSGVEWLGNIPCDWEVMQLKRSVLDCVNGIWGSESENDGNDTIVIRVADFDRPRLSIVDDGFTYRKIDPKEKRTRLLKRGDLLLEKSGGGEKTLVGQVVLFDKNFAAVSSNFVAKMTPNSGFSGCYLNYVFSRFYGDNINYCSIKQNTGIQNLDSASYLSEKFGFPPLPEQENIAAFLDHETAKIDALIEKQQRLIGLAQERRTALISAAVTGKIDVRDWQPAAAQAVVGVEC